MKLYVKNTLEGLIPLYPADHDAKKRLKIGRDYEVEIKHPRNYEFHKKFFALLNLAHSNSDTAMPFDAYRRYLTMKAGYFDCYQTGKGTYFEAKSIAFASMNQEEFEEVFNRVLDVVLAEIGCDREDVMQEILNFS